MGIAGEFIGTRCKGKNWLWQMLLALTHCMYLPGSFSKCDPPALVVTVMASAKVVGATPRIGLCKLSLNGVSVLLPPDILHPMRNTASKPQ